MSMGIPSSDVDGPARPCASTMGSPHLVREEVDGVRRVVPQEIVGPTASLTERVRYWFDERSTSARPSVGSVSSPRDDSLMNPLVRGVESSRVADHADETGLTWHARDALGVRPASRRGDLDLHVLPARHGGDGLLRVELRRREKMTASMSGVARTSSRSTWSPAARRRCRRPRGPGSSRRLTTAAISTSSMRASASRCLIPKAPGTGESDSH